MLSIFLGLVWLIFRVRMVMSGVAANIPANGSNEEPFGTFHFLRFELRDLSYLSIVFNTGYMCMGTMHMQDHGYSQRRTQDLGLVRPTP